MQWLINLSPANKIAAGALLLAIITFFVNIWPKALPPEYSINYTVLDYVYFDDVLSGDIDHSFFKNKTYILKNKIYSNLKQLNPLVKDFQENIKYAACNCISKTHGEHIIDEKTIKKLKEKFINDDYYFSFYNSVIPEYYSNRFVGLVNNKNINDLFVNYDGLPKIQELIINKNKKFDDLAIEEVYEIGCGGSSRIILTFRPIKLLGLSIKNISNTPVRIEEVSGVEIEKNILELTKWKGNLPKSSTPLSMKLPQKHLEKDESLFIPLHIFLGSFEEFESFPASEDIVNNIIENKIKLHHTNYYDDSNGAFPIAGDSYEIDIYAPKKKGVYNVSNEYILGSWITPEKVNNKKVRKFDKNNIVYLEGLAVGSCPYVYIKGKTGKESKIGSIISNNNGKDKEGFSHLSLPDHFDGKITIKEIDDEVSYIDQIFLLKTNFDGTKKIIESKNDLLSKKDGIYYKMKTGDVIELEFDNLGQYSHIELVSYGYFVLNR